MKAFFKYLSFSLVVFVFIGIVSSCGDDNENFDVFNSGKKVVKIDNGIAWKEYKYDNSGKLKTYSSGSYRWDTRRDVDIIYDNKKVSFKFGERPYVFYLNNQNLADSLIVGEKKVYFSYENKHLTRIFYNNDNYIKFQWSQNAIVSVISCEDGSIRTRNYTYTDKKNKSRIYEEQYLGSWFDNEWMSLASFIGLFGEPTEYLPQKCIHPFEYTFDEDGYVLTESSSENGKVDTKRYYYE